MFDIRWIREHPEAFDAGLARRGLAPRAAGLLALDERRRAAQTELQTLQQRRNVLSKTIGRLKGQGEEAAEELAEMAALKERLPQLEEEDRVTGAELDGLLAEIPNLPADDVPDGADDADNVELRRWGTPPAFDFSARTHDALGEAWGLMDFERAAKLSGARFVVLRGDLARLERALANFMLDLHTTEHGYTEVNPPALVRDEALFGTGQLPKFADDLFHTTDDRWLIPTAEVPLTNLHAGEILEADSLPRRYTAKTWCFRAEAGAAGRDTRGMIRQHQFTKVEMVSLTPPEESPAELERMTRAAETVLERLELPYRTVILCSGDMGFAARKTYDIEVWLPGAGTYREISSCSDCGPFQARRMRARYRPAEGGATQPLHTLNGSGLAVGRTLVALLENHQQADGRVWVPAALRPYLGGAEVIGGDA